MSFGNFDSWEQAETTEDFFKQLDDENRGDGTSAEEVIKQLEDDTPENEEGLHEQEKDLFQEEEEENSNSGNGSQDEEDEVETGKNISVLNTLKDKGFINFELEENQELTEEFAEELLEDKFEETIEERIAEKLGGLPEDVQQVVQYVLKGGSLNDFLKQVVETGSGNISEDLDLSVESNQELVVREMLLQQDFDEETIEAQIETLKDSGKLKNIAEKRFTKWLSDNKTARASLVQQQEQRRQEIRDEIRESKRKMTETLNSLEEIGGLEPSKDDKKILPSFINDRTVKLNNGAEITEMQKELYYELPKNEQAMIQLAILLKNRNADGTFNFDNIAKKIKTKVTKDLKDNLRRNKNSIPKSGRQTSGEGKTLADYFTSKN